MSWFCTASTEYLNTMQIKPKIAAGALAWLIVALPCGVLAQNSSINAFSPYTMYGIGDLSVPGTAANRGIGGAGVALSSSVMLNPLNPASASNMRQQTVLFNVGVETQSFYEKSRTQKTSYYTGNIQNVSLQLPLARKIGFIFNLSPLSSVGYRIAENDLRPEILANIGQVKYKYSGEGGISQFSAGVGMEIFKNFSLGAELIYYLGSIQRYYDVDITPVTGLGTYSDVSASAREEISRFSGSFGFQYRIISDLKRVLSIGGTYRPATKLNPDVRRFVQSGNIFGDTVFLHNYNSELRLPHMLTVGVFYANMKLSTAIDYTYQSWSKGNMNDQENGVNFTDSHSFKAGLQFVPNMLDARRALKRWSYRIGYRYNTYYLTFKDRTIRDNAITLGLGIPLKLSGGTALNVALDLGIRGSTGHDLIQEKYLKLSIGFNFFASPDEGWFRKRKFK